MFDNLGSVLTGLFGATGLGAVLVTLIKAHYGFKRKNLDHDYRMRMFAAQYADTNADAIQTLYEREEEWRTWAAKLISALRETTSQTAIWPVLPGQLQGPEWPTSLPAPTAIPPSGTPSPTPWDKSSPGPS